MNDETTSSPPSDGLDADAVIIGGGPAGCGAAYDLAANGFRVMIVDRTVFPRKKTCAGGLTVKTAEALRYSAAPMIKRTLYDLAVSCRMRHHRLLKSPRPICHMVDRTAFDAFCLEKTMAAGARFEVVSRIEKIVENGNTVSLHTDRGIIRTRFLVGADGVYSRVRRLTGRFPELRIGFAVQGIMNTPPSTDLNMGFDFSRMDRGYGWVFPKDTHVNVGLYTSRSDVKITRKDLIGYAGQRIGGQWPVHIGGFSVGLGGWRYRPGQGRVLLIGDAAGLVDPLLGEGLYNAIKSGQMAAAAILDAEDTGCDACQCYGDLLKSIQQDLLFSHLAAACYYRLPALGHLLLTSPVARIPLMNGFARGMPLIDIFRFPYPFWFGPPLPDKRNRRSF